MRRSCCALLLLTLLGCSRKPDAARTVIRYVDPDIGVETLPARKAAQEATRAKFEVPVGFTFTDRLEASGITFVQHPVADAKVLKGVHYDHGNGIVAADVDNDGNLDLYFVNQIGGNELWRNLGNGRFENITAKAGVAVPGRVGVTAAFADIDNDGDPDLFVTTVRGGNLLFENDGHGVFRDISHQAGVDLVAHSSGAVFFDYNRDGLIDLLVTNVGKYTNDEKWPDGSYVGLRDAFNGHKFDKRYEFPTLYRNLGGGRFADVTKETGIDPAAKGWAGDATFSDVNGDGWPDLYILNMQGRNHYLENQRGERFIDKTATVFGPTPWGAMGVKFFDFGNDGKLDLFVTDMHSDMTKNVGPELEKQKPVLDGAHHGADYLLGQSSEFVFGNALYRNRGNGAMHEELSDKLGAENYWPWGPSIADVNADGWDDIFIASSMNFPFRYGINSMLLNNKGKGFLDAEFLLGVEPRKSTHTPWFDIDCSAQTADPLICRGNRGMVTVLSPLGTRSSVFLDLDGDGDLDLVTNEFGSAPQVLVSDLASRAKIHWVQVKLKGTASNRDGLGALVRVHAAGLVQTKQADGKSGYLSQSAMPLYFGLGEASKIERIEVEWPSGKKQSVAAPAANQTVLIEELK